MKFQLCKKHIPIITIGLFGVLIFTIGIINHYYFKTATYDYGNYNFAFWDYSHFRISTLPMLGCNFLQDHYSFTLMYFVPVYWLINWLTGTYTLIIIQSSFIVVAAWYSYKIIKLKSDNYFLLIGVVVYYFVLLGRYSSFSGDVNLAIISSCFIPIFLYYFEIRKYIIASLILVLSLFSRENIPLWFIFIFIVLIIQNIKDKKAVFYSIGGIIVSIAYFVLLFKVLIPSVESPDRPYSLFNYSALGATPADAFSFILGHPFESLKMFFVNHLSDPQYNGTKIEFYIVYIVSGGFVLFFRPQYFIWFLPIVAQKVLNDSPNRWGISSYLSIELVTLLPVSVFLTISSLKKPKLQNLLVVLACACTIGMTIHKLDAKNRSVPWMMNPHKEKFYNKVFYQKPFDIKKVNKALALLPSDAKVSASNVFVPHLAQRPFIYFFPDVWDADYIVFSVFDNHYLLSQQQNEQQWFKYLSDPNWEVLALEYPVFILRRCDINKTCKSPIDRLFGNKEIITTENYNSDVGASLELPSVIIDSTNNIYHIKAEVWCNCKKDQVCILATGGKKLYKVSYESDSINTDGFQRIVLNTWLPKEKKNYSVSIKVVSKTNEPIDFKDFKVTVDYKGKEHL